jgi:hypothetical protein
MNEKIKQLALDAGIGFTLWDDSGREMIDNYTPEEYLEKFAELIVRECAGIVDDKIEVSRYVHEAELLRECSTTIKQHFGVEE